MGRKSFRDLLPQFLIHPALQLIVEGLRSWRRLFVVGIYVLRARLRY